MGKFTQDFLKVFTPPQLNEYLAVTVGKEYEEFVAELLGRKLSKSVYMVEQKDEKIVYQEYRVGDKWSVDKLLSIGYEVVERVWNEGEISILGENILIWPYSSKYIFRFTLFGNAIEQIEILDPTSRNVVEKKSFARIFPKDYSTVIGNETNEEFLVIQCVPNIFVDEDVADLGIRSLPYFSLTSLSKSSVNILKDYKRRGYHIWYLTHDLLRYKSQESLSEYIDRIYEIEDSVEDTLKKGFLYEKGKLFVLTDAEVLGEVLLKHEGAEGNIDKSSIELLKKVFVGDFVVHEDHGIGKFLGVVEKEGIEYIEIAYAGNDRLYVPLSASDKVMKYIGSGKA
ncbi:MAG TPA: CarD family transcriptional regulator, partial [Candidatus Dojkabacteria bacterium]|nr:CarD family transcriptional regulator [Candidatus Dojkabacteria bacterium]